MTVLQISLRVLSAPILLVALFFGYSYARIALEGGTFQLGLGLGLSALSVVGGLLVSLILWWMGDIHQYLDDLTSA